MRADLLRILGLWRGRLPLLVLGAVLAMLGLAAAVGLMALSGAMIAAAVATGTLVAPVLLRGLGGARIVLRYAERLVTHAATFRALADLRVWFFRRVAATPAQGPLHLGHGQAPGTEQQERVEAAGQDRHQGDGHLLAMQGTYAERAQKLLDDPAPV